MSLNIFQKFFQTIQLEIAKKSDPAFVNFLNSVRTKKPILVSEVKIIQKNGEVKMFNRLTMKFVSLSKQCKDILEMCDGFNSVEEISQKIYKKKLLKRKFLEDLVLFLDKLEKESFILWK
jgi:hypothetical protein